MGLFSFFNSNKKDVAANEFTKAKMQLAEALFEKLQSALQTHMEDCPNVIMSDETHYGRINSIAYWNPMVGLIINENKNLQNNIDTTKDRDDRKQKKKLYDSYNKPCFDYINQTVLPCYLGYADKYAGGWEKDYFSNDMKVISETKNEVVNKDISKWDKVVQEGQRELILNIFSSFATLANMKPNNRVDIKDLTGMAMDLAKNNEMSTLSKFLSKGYAGLDINSLDLLSLDL